MPKFRRKDTQSQQPEFWLRPEELVVGATDGFYKKLAAVLEAMNFAAQVHAICEPYYKMGGSSGGRPPVDPAVIFKMHIVGFLEGIGSDRGIAARCADSLTIRRFLGYSLTEQTPDHSSFTVFRQRLDHDAFQAVHRLVLEGLKKHGLLRGKHLGIDSSVMEANASLSGLVSRNTEEGYWDYVKKLAQEAGVDPSDAAAVARFDRKRKGRSTSNKDWYNPHDAEAKVGRDKHGACDMLHKPEHIVDLESGAIVAAEVRPGDAADTEQLARRVLDAVEVVESLHEQPHEQGSSCVESLTGDKGFHDLVELAEIRHESGLRTIMGDAHAARRCQTDMEPELRQVLRATARAVASKSGKALLKARGEHIERGFAHVLDSGGLRRTTLRGLENITKRYLCGIFAFNLSLIMRRLTGVGTPKQAAAQNRGILSLLFALWRGLITRIPLMRKNAVRKFRANAHLLGYGKELRFWNSSRFSTGS
jgi:transposase